MTSNYTHAGTEVVPAQLWKNPEGRVLVVVSVTDGTAFVRDHYGTERTSIKISQMHEHPKGFQLVKRDQYRYGVHRSPATTRPPGA